MRAGFAKISITPPIGTRMQGIGERDLFSPCTSIHDDIYVRALYTEHEGEAALIMSFDLCFIGRRQSDRFKGSIARRLELLPRQILLSATHSHVSPVADNYLTGNYQPVDQLYMDAMEKAVVLAAITAHGNAREATMSAGEGRSRLPMNRRRPVEGGTDNAPNPDGKVIETMPVCLFKDEGGKPFALLYSIAAHPSLMRGYAISAEFCGTACDVLDEYLGCEGSLFLQGTAGDSKPSTIALETSWNWGPSWEIMEETGRILAREVIGLVEDGLQPVAPQIHSAITETHWPLQPAPERGYFEKEAAEGRGPMRREWAAWNLECLDKYGQLPSTAPIHVQGIQLGDGLRLVGVEGEPVSAYGEMIKDAFGSGTTFPLGYANGEGMYLVTSEMLPQGGMEVTSYWEYNFPSRLAPGMETSLEQGIAELRRLGIE